MSMTILRKKYWECETRKLRNALNNYYNNPSEKNKKTVAKEFGTILSKK